MKGAINLHNIVSETECLVVKAQCFPPYQLASSLLHQQLASNLIPTITEPRTSDVLSIALIHIHTVI